MIRNFDAQNLGETRHYEASFYSELDPISRIERAIKEVFLQLKVRPDYILLSPDLCESLSNEGVSDSLYGLDVYCHCHSLKPSEFSIGLLPENPFTFEEAS